MADVSIQFSGSDFEDGPFYLTQTEGWTRLIDVLNTRSREDYPSLKVFVETGELLDTESLSLEIEEFREDLDADEEDVEGLLDSIIEYVGVGDPEETVTIIGDE